MGFFFVPVIWAFLFSCLSCKRFRIVVVQRTMYLGSFVSFIQKTRFVVFPTSFEI